MSRAQVKKILSTLSKDQLEELVLDLYDARKGAKEYLEFFADPNSDALLETLCKKIEDNFYLPGNKARRRVRLTPANVALDEFIKSCPGTAYVAQAMMYYAALLTDYYFFARGNSQIAAAAMRQFRRALEYADANSEFKGSVAKRAEKIIGVWLDYYSDYKETAKQLAQTYFPEKLTDNA